MDNINITQTELDEKIKHSRKEYLDSEIVIYKKTQIVLKEPADIKSVLKLSNDYESDYVL